MSGDDQCVFCMIAQDQLPSLKVFEDQDILAFLDVSPLADGHLLIIPKQHFIHLDKMPADLVGALCRQLPRLAAAVVAATGAQGYNVLQNNSRCAGQVVQHVHFHIIPRVQDDGLGYRWLAKKYPQDKDKQVHQQILQALSGQ